jgi:hypothetical protein
MSRRPPPEQWRPCARWWNRDMTDLMDRMQALNDSDLDPTWPFEAYDAETQESIWTWCEAFGLEH